MFQKSCRPAQGNHNCCYHRWHFTAKKWHLESINNKHCLHWGYVFVFPSYSFSFDILSRKGGEEIDIRVHLFYRQRIYDGRKYRYLDVFGVIHQIDTAIPFLWWKICGSAAHDYSSRFENPPFRFKLIYYFFGGKISNCHLAETF